MKKDNKHRNFNLGRTSTINRRQRSLLWANKYFNEFLNYGFPKNPEWD
jgi:hypothetical protein